MTSTALYLYVEEIPGAVSGWSVLGGSANLMRRRQKAARRMFATIPVIMGVR